MLGHLKNNITRLNREELTKKYKRLSYIYFCVCIVLIFLMPFTNYLNVNMQLFPDYNKIDAPFEMHVLDVGQALCIVVHTENNKNIVYDTGKLEDWETVEKYIDKVILRNGGSLDCMIISHVDGDHSGNANNILIKYKPKQVFIPNMKVAIENHNYIYEDNYKDFLNNLYSSDSIISYNYAGVNYNLEDLQLTWLAPNKDYYENNNDYSAVILVEYNNFKSLLTGDTGHNSGLSNYDNTEMQALNYAYTHGLNMDIDVLIAGHHGSKYSTSYDMLNITKPENIIVSVGKNNYGQPSNELYQNAIKYDNENNTNLSKNIYITLDSNNIVVSYNLESYKINFIDSIHSYLFVSFIVVDILIFVPTFYMLIDSAMIYNKIINSTRKRTKN